MCITKQLWMGKTFSHNSDISNKVWTWKIKHKKILLAAFFPSSFYCCGKSFPIHIVSVLLLLLLSIYNFCIKKANLLLLSCYIYFLCYSFRNRKFDESMPDDIITIAHCFFLCTMKMKLLLPQKESLLLFFCSCFALFIPI